MSTTAQEKTTIQSVSLKDLQDNFSEVSEMVNDSPVIIMNNGQQEAVIINMKVYADFEEYLNEKLIIEELEKREKKAKDPNTKWYGHEEFWDSIEGKKDV